MGDFPFHPLGLLLWLPPMLILGAGLGWIVAALTVYLRDLAHVVALGITALMFLAPIFYPLAQVPAGLQAWMLLNPVTLPAEALRAALLGSTALPPGWLLGYWLAALAVFLAGAWLFKALSKGFADVL
jgi:lipopolysaccharide transport system permease protein